MLSEMFRFFISKQHLLILLAMFDTLFSTARRSDSAASYNPHPEGKVKKKIVGWSAAAGNVITCNETRYSVGHFNGLCTSRTHECSKYYVRSWWPRRRWCDYIKMWEARCIGRGKAKSQSRRRILYALNFIFITNNYSIVCEIKMQICKSNMFKLH